MRVGRMALLGLLAITLGASEAAAQAPVNPPDLAGIPLGLKAPTDHSVEYPADQLDEAFKEAIAQKLYAFRILEGGTFNINIRGQYAPEELARIHTTIHDLFFIRSGEGEMTTGGELVDQKAGGPGGVELSGTSIRNGVTKAVKPGDVVYVPAGVPHQVTKSDGTLQFLLVRWHVHE